MNHSSLSMYVRCYRPPDLPRGRHACTVVACSASFNARPASCTTLHTVSRPLHAPMAASLTRAGPSSLCCKAALGGAAPRACCRASLLGPPTWRPAHARRTRCCWCGCQRHALRSFADTHTHTRMRTRTHAHARAHAQAPTHRPTDASAANAPPRTRISAVVPPTATGHSNINCRAAPCKLGPTGRR
jgi:hypothetical protein